MVTGLSSSATIDYREADVGLAKRIMQKLCHALTGGPISLGHTTVQFRFPVGKKLREKVE